MGSFEKSIGGIGLKVFKGFVLEKDLDPEKIDRQSVKNILVILRHQMGDLLCAAPMMRSLKSFYPEAKLILVTKSSTNYEKIFTGSNAIADEVLIYEKGFEKFINLSKALSENKIDLAVVPSTVTFSSTNHLIAHYSGARIRVGVKTKNYEENKTAYLLNVKSDFNWNENKIHQVERNLDIIRQLKINPGCNKIKIIPEQISLEKVKVFFDENLIDRNKKLIVLHTGAAKKENVWPAAKFAELIYMIHNNYSSEILISEGPIDKKYVAELTRILKQKYGVSRYFIVGKDLTELVSVLSLSDLFVSNDTGVMHLASGLEIPIIALFGPTKAYEWGPLGENKISIQAAGGNMATITVTSVYNHCSGILSGKKAQKTQ